MDATPAPPRQQRAAHRGAALWLMALTAAVVILVVVVTAALHHTLSPQVPNLAALTRSPQVTGRDEASRTALARQFTQIGQRAPWLATETEGISDSCQLQAQASQVVLSPASWFLQCQRQQTVYYAFNGNRASRLLELQSVLRTQGWAAPAKGTASSAPSGSFAGAGSLPVTMTPALSDPPALPGKISMRVAWASRGRSLHAVSALTATAPRSDDRFTRVLGFQPASPVSIAQATFRRHTCLVAIQITAQYYEVSVPGTPQDSSG